MSQRNGNGLQLEGTGAAYIRISDDEQDTQRQYAAARAFEQRHGVTIPEPHKFKDEGWARDKADVRPEFQRLIKLVEAGRVRWIVVDQLDRFGTKDPHQLVAYLYRLREAGCKLYDAADREWTAADIATIITAVVEGEKSKGEQTSKSHRTLGGMVEKARDGEWQGGLPGFALDVACYPRADVSAQPKELWRVVFDGPGKRLKVWPDRPSERFDGKGNFPAYQEKTEVLRLTPSRDRGKLDALATVFKRYATEAVSPSALAHFLNELGWRNSQGGYFHGKDVQHMLSDENYLGYYTWKRLHCGKFRRHKGGQQVEEFNYDEQVSKNDPADWVYSRRRLFEPLIPRETWAAVQQKLADVAAARAGKPARAPRSAAAYLSELACCGNCGCSMYAGSRPQPTKRLGGAGPTGKRYEYFCSTYFEACRERRRKESKCLRNAVGHDVLKGYVDRYLEEIGRRLEVLTGGPPADAPTARLEQAESGQARAFEDGIRRLTGYLAERHPDEYNQILAEFARRAAEDRATLAASAGSPGVPPGTVARKLGKRFTDACAAGLATPTDPAILMDEYVAACCDAYRSVFDPAAVARELAALNAEQARLVERWADLPTQRAKDTAKARLTALDQRITELERQRADVAQEVTTAWAEVYGLQQAIADARQALSSDTGERALRRRAEALRKVIHRIECTFRATGHTTGGWKRKVSELTSVTIYPLVGDARTYKADPESVLPQTSGLPLP
jgi:DNA invertase Pin-like site-specific DNA recombinase